MRYSGDDGTGAQKEDENRDDENCSRDGAAGYSDTEGEFDEPVEPPAAPGAREGESPEEEEEDVAAAAEAACSRVSGCGAYDLTASCAAAAV